MTSLPQLWSLVAAVVVVGALIGVFVAWSQRRRARARATQLLDAAWNNKGVAHFEKRLSDLDGRLTKVDTERRELLRAQRELTVLVETRDAELSTSQGALREKIAALAELASENARLTASLDEQRRMNDRAMARAAVLEAEHQSALGLLAEQHARMLELERGAAEAQRTTHSESERTHRELGDRLAAVERELLDARARTTELSEQVSASKAESDALARALAVARDAAAARESEAGELRSGMRELQCEVDALAERRGELERDCEELRGELARERHAARERTQQADARFAQLAACEQALRDQESAAVQRAERAEAQVDPLQRRISALSARLDESAAEVTRLEGELQASRELLAEASTRAADAAQREREALGSREALEARLLALQTQADQAATHSNEQIAGMESRLAEQEAEAQRLSVELERHERALAEQSELREAAHARIREVELELSSRAEELASAQRRVGETEAHLAAREHELQGHIDGCDRELERRAQALTNAGRELEQRRSELESLQRDLAEQASSRAAAEARAEQFRVRVEALERSLGEREDQLSQAEEQRRSLGQHSSGLEAALADRAAQLNEREQLLHVVRSQVESLTAQLERSQRGLEEQSASRAELVRQFDAERAALEDQARERVAALERALADRDDRLAQQEAQRRALDELSVGLEAQLENRALELIEREHLLEGVRGEVEALAADVDRWRADAAMARDSLDELASARLAAIFGRRGAQGTQALPQAYLDGLDQRDLAAAVRGLLGDPQPLSSAAFERLAEHWSEQHAAWRRAPVGQEVVYLWFDGLRVKAGLPDDGDTLLLAVAGLADGSRAVVAVERGAREAADSWGNVLAQLRAREMSTPRIVVADAELGVWQALRAQGYECAQQRCWGYELAALVSQVPERSRRPATQLLRRIAHAPDRAKAVQARSAFLERYSKRCPEAAERLGKHWRELTAFYAFPEDHWVHLRSTAAVASALEALRLAGGGSGSAVAAPHAVAILWRLLLEAERRGRRLNASHLLAEVAQTASSKKRRRKARA